MTTPTASTTTMAPTESTVTATTTVTGPTTTVTGPPTTTTVVGGQSTTLATATTTVTVQPATETATTFTTVTPTPTTTTAASTTTVTTTVPSTTTVTTTVPATTTVTATTTVAGPTTTVPGSTTTVYPDGTVTYTFSTVTSTATAAHTATTTGTVTAPTRTVTVDEYTSTTTAISVVTNTVTTVTCFCSGTLIRILRDGGAIDVAVEALQIGDLAITASGARRPIRWIGHRHVRCDTHPSPRKVWPVRVRAGAFGAGLPITDLSLSPGHALCLADILVPVRALIDGARVAQVERAEVTYWHVELDGHDVLLANGIPAESYLDTGNRRFFGEDGVLGLHFDENPAPGWDGTGTCLPLVESGPRLSAIRTLYGLGQPSGPAARPVATGVHLVAGETAILPCVAGENELRFLLPAGTGDLRLVSPTFHADGDLRQLGVLVSGVAVSDGGCWHPVTLDDPSLLAGFHDLEIAPGSAWRWTDGSAHLTGDLWAELTGPVMLQVTGRFAGFGRPEADASAPQQRAA